MESLILRTYLMKTTVSYHTTYFNKLSLKSPVHSLLWSYKCYSAQLKTWNQTHKNANWKCKRVTGILFAQKYHHPFRLCSNNKSLLSTSNCWAKIVTLRFLHDCLKDVYNLPFVITLETKLQLFQYRIIHNILPTKCSLFRMKLCDSGTCHLSKMQAQTIGSPSLQVSCNFQILGCFSKLVVRKSRKDHDSYRKWYPFWLAW